MSCADDCVAASSDDDDALLAALSPSSAELKLLQCVEDAPLRDMLLFRLLRAPVGECVHVQINKLMGMSDSFCGAKLSEIVAAGEYVDATLRRISRDDDGEQCYVLSCSSQSTLDRTYEKDDIEDFLLQFFAKNLIRFPSSAVRNDTELKC